MKTDVRKDQDGVWIIDITDAADGQKLKNASSRRIVPLHPDLLAEGFLDHVGRSSGPLVFASLVPDQRGRLGGPYGKRFGRHLRKRAKITDPSLTFHSLRHRWKDAARDAGVPEAAQNAIMGHVTGSHVSAGYGRGASAKSLLAEMDRVKPFGD